jgi:hypothetical protein
MLLNASYTITADIDVPQDGAEGMILTSGGRFAGYGFYLLKGKPVFLWNLIDLKRVKWESPDALTPGKHIIEFDFKYDGLGIGTLAFNNMSGLGRPGTGTIRPSNDGNWQPEVAQTAWAEIAGEKVTIHNFRNFDYLTSTDFVPHWETKVFDLTALQGIDLFVNYWGVE